MKRLLSTAFLGAVLLFGGIPAFASAASTPQQIQDREASEYASEVQKYHLSFTNVTIDGKVCDLTMDADAFPRSDQDRILLEKISWDLWSLVYHRHHPNESHPSLVTHILDFNGTKIGGYY